MNIPFHFWQATQFIWCDPSNFSQDYRVIQVNHTAKHIGNDNTYFFLAGEGSADLNGPMQIF